jgi:hypothetical protein
MKDFDDIFRSAINAHEENPPAQVWSRIENKLDKDEAAKYRKKYLLFGRIALCLVIFIIAFPLYNTFIYFHNKETGLAKNTASSKIIVNPHRNMQLLPNNTSVISNHDISGLNSSNNIEEKISKKNTDAAANNIITANNLFEPVIPKRQETSTFYMNSSNKIQHTEVIRNVLSAKGFTQNQLIHDESIAANSLNIISEYPLKNNKSGATKKTQNKAVDESGKFSLTAFFSPDIAGSKLQQEYNFDNESKSEICNGEKSNFSFTTGALMQYHLSKNWALQSGLTFSTLTASISPKIIFAKQDVDGKIKFQFPTSYGVANIKSANNANPQIGDSLRLSANSYLQLHYFTVPFLVKYRFANKGKLDFNASLGGGVNIITDADMEVMVPVNSNQIKESIKDIEGIKKSNFSGMLGFEALYHYSKKVSFSIQPVIRYSLNSLNQNVPVKNLPYTFGFMAGVTVPL